LLWQKKIPQVHVTTIGHAKNFKRTFTGANFCDHFFRKRMRDNPSTFFLGQAFLKSVDQWNFLPFVTRWQQSVAKAHRTLACIWSEFYWSSLRNFFFYEMSTHPSKEIYNWSRWQMDRQPRWSFQSPHVDIPYYSIFTVLTIHRRHTHIYIYTCT